MDTSHIRRKVIDVYGRRTGIGNIGQFFNEEECLNWWRNGDATSRNGPPHEGAQVYHNNSFNHAGGADSYLPS